jgi:hypothetical protein
MNSSEVILDLHKLKGVTAASVDLHIPRELERNSPRAARIALAHTINSHLGGNILYDYSEVKEKVWQGRGYW